MTPFPINHYPLGFHGLFQPILPAGSYQYAPYIHPLTLCHELLYGVAAGFPIDGTEYLERTGKWQDCNSCNSNSKPTEDGVKLLNGSLGVDCEAPEVATRGQLRRGDGGIQQQLSEGTTL